MPVPVGYLTTLTIGSLEIPNLTMLSLPDGTCGDADITSFESTGNPPRRQWQPVFWDEGEGSFELLYDDASYNSLAEISGQSNLFTIEINGSDDVMTFSGYINKGPTAEANLDDVLRIKCSFKCGGAVSFSAGT